MPEYSFFFWTDGADSIADVQVIECPNDDDAILALEEIFRRRSEFLVVEIWNVNGLLERRLRQP